MKRKLFTLVLSVFFGLGVSFTKIQAEDTFLDELYDDMGMPEMKIYTKLSQSKTAEDTFTFLKELERLEKKKRKKRFHKTKFTLPDTLEKEEVRESILYFRDKIEEGDNAISNTIDMLKEKPYKYNSTQSEEFEKCATQYHKHYIDKFSSFYSLELNKLSRDKLNKTYIESYYNHNQMSDLFKGCQELYFKAKK